jgi:hypothetical protein
MRLPLREQVADAQARDAQQVAFAVLSPASQQLIARTGVTPQPRSSETQLPSI